jgi:Flp pilus assembly pilin Flp
MILNNYSIHIRFIKFFRKEAQMLWHYHRERGQGLVEYGLIIALIALAVVSALMIFGESLFGYYFSDIVTKFIDATTP